MDGIPDLLCRLFFANAPLRRDGIADLVGNTDTRCSGAEDNQTKVTQLLLCDVRSCYDGS
jgi:hypothetical protein